jgi:hypothetical protein
MCNLEAVEDFELFVVAEALALTTAVVAMTTQNALSATVFLRINNSLTSSQYLTPTVRIARRVNHPGHPPSPAFRSPVVRGLP